MIQQSPAPGARLLACAGDVLDVTLRLPAPRPGRACFRTNLGRADVRRAEIVACTESDTPPLARDWHDLPMTPTGPGAFRARVPLLDVGWFAGKACFLPEGSGTPEWPDGPDLAIKVGPAHAACANTVYTAFVRQFGPALRRDPRTAARRQQEESLDRAGYAVIPPSGTFRDLVRRLDAILGGMRFRILQLLPVFPTPAVYGRLGRYGSPFAGLDFLSVDPALAEFDRRATPLDQFGELADAVHCRGARLFLDLPANHTGWASTLQTRHPEWFRRGADGAFLSPGAWGVVWEDLVELDYRHPGLAAAMAEVFLFWARQGVDGFRCDAGYMIPVDIWTYIVARVRDEFPDTVFLLEGLGGPVETTGRLLADANLDWAYSEIFQMPDRASLERDLPAALALGSRTGPLVHFAETHDNVRLAGRGPAHARLRTALAALLSQQGAFGIANGVEWFADERIDVHGAAPLRWGARRNQVRAVARLNALLACHPAFAAGAEVQFVQQGPGNAVAALRRPAAGGAPVLALVNLDGERGQPVQWPAGAFDARRAWDLLAGAEFALDRPRLDLAPGQALCLAADPAGLREVAAFLRGRTPREPAAVARRRASLLALRVRRRLGGSHTLDDAGPSPEELGAALLRDPAAFCAAAAGGRLPRVAVWDWPADTRRTVMAPPGFLLLVRAPHPFRARLAAADGRVVAAEESLARPRDGHFALLDANAARPPGAGERKLQLSVRVFAPDGVVHASSSVLALAPGAEAAVMPHCDGHRVRAGGGVYAVLGNGRGAMAQVRAAWGEVRSQYDALLAVNADPDAPGDRIVFLSRCRAWLRHCGYSHAVDATCLEAFEADPGGAFAAWRFRVPTGLGAAVTLRFRLRLAPGRNRAELAVTREADGGGLDGADPVTVVLRPDIEWRSFHGKTKAFTGPEKQWPAAVGAEPRGFVFRPAAGETLAVRSDRGAYHAEAQWQYLVAHPDDAARGLDGATDLFSPGWFGIELEGGATATLTAEREEPAPAGAAAPRGDRPSAAAPGGLALPDALRRALDLYIVRRGGGRTIVAGYPWFLDWGRDTLIALRGFAAAGRAGDALRILCVFGGFERGGTLPNMLSGADDANRDTSDAPLWFGAAAADLIQALGAEAVLAAPCAAAGRGTRPLADVLLSIARHYGEGTGNGIRVDRDSGLVYSPPHFTWMDTNHPAATPREGYPVEIQALWIAFLELLAARIDASWRPAAQRARASLARLYWLQEDGWLADNLRGGAGTPAAKAQPEDALRPNQLLALTLGALEGGRDRGAAILRACETLLVPGAIRSLADRPVRVAQPVTRDGRTINDPLHPYWGRYEGDEDTRRKPAYHNGTAWTWLYPSYAEALVRVHGDEARAPARALLGAIAGVMGAGCLGQVPELLEGDAPHAPRGCGAQAWGVSEFLRVWTLLDTPAALNVAR